MHAFQNVSSGHEDLLGASEDDGWNEGHGGVDLLTRSKAVEHALGWVATIFVSRRDVEMVQIRSIPKTGFWAMVSSVEDTTPRASDPKASIYLMLL